MSFCSSSGTSTSRDINTTHILSLDKDLCVLLHSTQSGIYDETGVTVKSISVDDTPETDMLKYFPEICEFIQGGLRCSGRVLVHC